MKRRDIFNDEIMKILFCTTAVEEKATGPSVKSIFEPHSLSKYFPLVGVRLCTFLSFLLLNISRGTESKAGSSNQFRNVGISVHSSTGAPRAAHDHVRLLLVRHRLRAHVLLQRTRHAAPARSGGRRPRLCRRGRAVPLAPRRQEQDGHTGKVTFGGGWPK